MRTPNAPCRAVIVLAQVAATLFMTGAGCSSFDSGAAARPASDPPADVTVLVFQDVLDDTGSRVPLGLADGGADGIVDASDGHDVATDSGPEAGPGVVGEDAAPVVSVQIGGGPPELPNVEFCAATVCGAECVHTLTDVDHCGGCFQQCPAPNGGFARCRAGRCLQGCDQGDTLVDGACVPGG